MKKMYWLYCNNRIIKFEEQIIENSDSMNIEVFEYLTGKKINWSKREHKKIMSLRDRGHIRLYDENLIEMETYKHPTLGIYKCVKVDKHNTGLLNKIGANMSIKFSNIPFDTFWEIT